LSPCGEERIREVPFEYGVVENVFEGGGGGQETVRMRRMYVFF
jgi:hypothetical protein